MTKQFYDSVPCEALWGCIGSMHGVPDVLVNILRTQIHYVFPNDTVDAKELAI